MHLAWRCGKSHDAVKLLQPWSVWPRNQICFARCYATQHVGFGHPPGHYFEGAYEPKAAPNPRAQNIAILGGGISGLATAFNLTRDLPNAKITIFEAKHKLGGWVDSERVEANDGECLFEWGPRTLRPDLRGNGLATARLIHQLPKLGREDIVAVSRSAPAALNRYIYYPDHLVRMPGPSPAGLVPTVFTALRTVLTEPIFRGTLWNILAEASVATRSEDLKDESVGSFISRRYGKAIADNFLSALFHGIYAGDIYKLSARTLFPKLWYLETRDPDGNGVNTEIMELQFKQQSLHSWESLKAAARARVDDAALDDKDGFQAFVKEMSHCSVYSFTRGIGQLTHALTDALLENQNVTIETGAEVSEISFDGPNSRFAVTCRDGHTAGNFNYAVCTLAPSQLERFLSSTDASRTQHSSLLSSLSRSPKAVNVMVVNLYYSSPRLPIPRGFGYLIPRSISLAQNPERALGVIFSSETSGPKGQDSRTKVVVVKEPLDRSNAQWVQLCEAGDRERQIDYIKSVSDEVEREIGQDSASGTKLTVMLGGHWWDEWTDSDLPSEEEGIEMAKSVIERHLGVTEKPLVAKARLQKQCIPQYQVGYRDYMSKIHGKLLDDFAGRMKVTGAWWQGGAGVNDCVVGAREASRGIRESWDEETGLEKYVGEEQWYIRDERSGISVKDPFCKK